MSLDLLAEYDSGSEEEPHSDRDEVVRHEAPPKERKAPKKTTKLKRRIKSSKLLPAHIQRALETGVLPSDDEDDDDRTETKLRKKAGRGSQDSGLLSVLPPPAHGGLGADQSNGTEDKKQDQKNSEEEEEDEDADEDADEDDDTDDEGIGQLLERSEAPRAKAAPVSIPSVPERQLDADVSARAVESHELPYPGVASAPVLEAPPPQPEASMDEFYAIPESSGPRKRRREDEAIVAALQSGNMEAVDNLTGGLAEWQGHDAASWNRYGEGATANPLRDVKVSAQFYGRSAGEMVTSSQASRLHRQKHQINQLAQDALRLEAELSERRHKATKTKAQTHAKYGW